MILDTNVISEAISVRPDHLVMKWFATLEPEMLTIPSVVKAELLAGVAFLPAGRRRDVLGSMIRDFLDPYEPVRVLPFESADAPFYAQVLSSRRSAGRPVKELDAQIAAIALRRGLPIATRNVRDFADCGVTLINPWDPAP
ncbi:MAG: type II toxin-antitoxin system VapC family toxin [Hoeflea sp.]|uniref:type II toxin-antitoxin system VapC family toxin n=1 Tax=Hoeflea sp. TaxID=1940281 RepID=UPI003296F1AD